MVCLKSSYPTGIRYLQVHCGKSCSNSLTHLNISLAYHPQTDGQTERLNQCLKTYLRCMVQACPTKWSQWLSQDEFWYNTTYHSALGKIPFEVLYGHPPRHFGITSGDHSSSLKLEEWLHDRAVMSKLIQQHFLRAKQKMKAQAGKKRSVREFQVGDLVYLKLQPYVQLSVARRSSHKLCFKYFRPYKIIQKVGKIAYKLDLPEGSLIHPVIHVSQLKKAIKSPKNVSPDHSLNLIYSNQLLCPVAIVTTRLS